MKTLFYLLFIIIFSHVPNIQLWRFRPGKFIRRFIALGFLEYCGKNANIEYRCNFANKGKGVRVGHNSGIGVKCQIGPFVTVGNDVMMGPEVVIITANHQFLRTDCTIREQGYQDYKPVVVEDDVWIGQRVMIMPGVTIGKGSIIGAGAVVAKNVPPYSIAVGNPCRVIKSRLIAPPKPL